MSKFSHCTRKKEAKSDIYDLYEDKRVINFMQGISYTTNPLLKLEMIAASSIFGESSYYLNSGLNEKNLESSTIQMFVNACDDALEYDFEKTLDIAKKLRNEYNMRLNSSLIIIRAAMHKNRPLFNKEHKKIMRNCIKEIVNIPTDIWNQFELWMFFNKSKNKLPSILKRSWCDILSMTKRYQLAKYKNIAHIIDLVRICHARSFIIEELMKTSNIQINEEQNTWEKLKSQGKNWKEILEIIKMNHMALLRNLRGIFKEIGDESIAMNLLNELENGVINGKQFPYRYWSALKEISSCSSINFQRNIIETLNRCIDKSMENFPKLKGKTICLSDNSGSAWGSLTTSYGCVKVAEINNLSSVMTAYNSDEGKVGVFGDKLKITSINKRDGVLSQLELIQHKFPIDVLGGSTENGIWLFFDDAIKNKIFYDNIFIYSDQQAGHGGLYGLNCSEYQEYIYKNRYIDVLKLLQIYRENVNPKVNVFSVQTAGYDNSVLPENLYRTSILTGWTGKEILYAKELIDIWDKIDNDKKPVE